MLALFSVIFVLLLDFYDSCCLYMCSCYINQNYLFIAMVN